MADLDIQRLESYQYPNTHVGHISPQHQQALEEFKRVCEQKGYYTLRGENGLPSHDDETMLRYLRARKFVPQDAFQQFKETEDWRKANQIDKLYDTIDVDEYDQSRRLYPQWTGRRDRRGIPVYVFEVAHLNAKAVAAANEKSTKTQGLNVSSKIPPKMLRLFALYENLVNFALPLCSTLPDRQYPETPVSQSNNIVDISNVGLKQFWNLKSHMQDASQLATAHYPETLDRIFVIGAPSFFPTVWGWIKRWFDPITVSKIFILDKSTMKSTLEQYIDPENIPTQYGGKLQYKFGDLPNLDKTIQASLAWSAPTTSNGSNTFPAGPVRWQRYENGDLAAIAVGSENGKPRNTKVAVLHPAAHVVQTSLGAGHQGHQLLRTTSGIDTHPREAQPTGSYTDTNTNTLSPTFQPSSSHTATYPSASSYQTSQTMAAPNTDPTTLPYRDANFNSTSSNSNSNSNSNTYNTYNNSSTNTSTTHPSTSRDGTSSTRYSAQSATHAHGNAHAGTPAVSGSNGDTYHVMEPNTVGQAPKEHPRVGGDANEAPAPGYLEQAQELAGQAYNSAAAVGGSALAAVGVGGSGGQETQQHEQEQKPRQVHDPRVDAASSAQVEEFLRARYSSGDSVGKELDGKM